LEDVSGSLADSLDLAVVSIRCFGELFFLLKSECIHKYSHNKTILGLNINTDVEERVPFTDELA
jgi:hypothetical protein